MAFFYQSERIIEGIARGSSNKAILKKYSILTYCPLPLQIKYLVIIQKQLVITSPNEGVFRTDRMLKLPR